MTEINVQEAASFVNSDIKWQNLDRILDAFHDMGYPDSNYNPDGLSFYELIEWTIRSAAESKKGWATYNSPALTMYVNMDTKSFWFQIHLTHNHCSFQYEQTTIFEL